VTVPAAMSAPSYRYEDRKPAKASFLEDVLAGLSSSPKTLPPKYFYDERGSRLFERICELPEYYPTRTELAMLKACGSEIAARVGPDAAIVEYGSGSGRKTLILVEAVHPLAYIAVDIADEQLRCAVGTLAAAFPDVRMVALCADYTQRLDLPSLHGSAVKKRLVFFPGSTIGNFSIAEALDFLVNAREVAGRGGAMLVGVDLKKDVSVLHAAYNDAQGVTAAFNLNVLRRINEELGGKFDLETFEHRAFYNGAASRIEMHLVSTRAQTVMIGSHAIQFAAGETIHTENSHKYCVEEFRSLAREAGFHPEHCWVDSERLFSIHYLTVPSAASGV
jgi:dimethylhistidine N-methyltransferase